jgi:hypothetical protein
MIYTHALNRGPSGVRSPLDGPRSGGVSPCYGWRRAACHQVLLGFAVQARRSTCGGEGRSHRNDWTSSRESGDKGRANAAEAVNVWALHGTVQIPLDTTHASSLGVR